jgi:hypothetical protein
MSGPSPAQFSNLGHMTTVSPKDVVEVLPGYKGPLTERDLNYKLPLHTWMPIQAPPPQPPKKTAGTGPVQIDGRSYTVDMVWSGLRFIIKVDALMVAPAQTTFNLFSTHIGLTFAGVAHWTEIGIIRSAQDPTYRLYTYSPPVLNEGDTWKFFGTTQPGDVFEFAIRLNETDAGPYGYETFSNGRRVRQGHLPRLDNQVDVSHETWSDNGAFSEGDYVMAVEGWVNFPPNKARWYAPDLNIGYYSSNSAIKQVRLNPPFAHKFESQIEFIIPPPVVHPH